VFIEIIGTFEGLFVRFQTFFSFHFLFSNYFFTFVAIPVGEYVFFIEVSV